MVEPKEILPPRWATRFLGWYCRPELAEDLEGDLFEFFQRNAKEKGIRRARLIYVFDVIKFLRPYTLRKPKPQPITHWLMLGSYIKTSGRNLQRNKLFSAINIAGLAISMSVGLLLIGVLSDVFSYDKFNVNHSRIYRVVSDLEYLKRRENNPMATTSLKAAKLIQDEFTGVERVAIFKNGFDGDVQYEEKTIPLSGWWANESLFRVFSFPMLKGNPETALRDPFTVVLTESAAKKLFGETEALGKTITLKEYMIDEDAFKKADKQYTITGILKDLPKFSHVQFEMLGSLPTFEILTKDQPEGMKWDNIWSTWVYLLLPEGSDPNSIQPQLDKLSEREDPTVKNTHIALWLHPLDDVMLGPDFNNQIGKTVGASTVWIFGSLAFVVILSACINYTNLSVARSLRRTREVGIRKVVGALKGHVRSQFIVEAMMISLCALVIALLLFLLIKPYFLNLERDMQALYQLALTPFNLLLFVVFALVLGVVAGFFPALFFSRINAIQVLKDISNIGISRRMTARKVLMVVQYCISIILITSTIIVFKQYKHYIAFDLGYSTENIINLPLQGNKPELLMKDVGELSEVVGISRSRIVTSVGNYWVSTVKSPEHPDDSSGVAYNIIDENYLALHDHQLLAGRNFTAKTGKIEESEVIVNTDVLKKFQIAGGDPQKALGQVLKIDGKEVTIIGVVKEFSYGRSNDRNNDRSVMFRYANEGLTILNIKVQSTDLVDTRAKLEAIWKKHDPVHPYEGKFYSEQLERAFSGLEASVKVAGVLAFLAISIASMGLLGMVVFTTETRLKEISIRKVLGATEQGLLFLLGKGFLTLLAIATLISLPITILFFEQVAFPEFANHAPLAFTEMTLGVLAVLGIALSMILSQTFKAARTNPAEVLKTE